MRVPLVAVIREAGCLSLCDSQRALLICALPHSKAAGRKPESRQPLSRIERDCRIGLRLEGGFVRKKLPEARFGELAGV
jgi:hypothetical protein